LDFFVEAVEVNLFFKFLGVDFECSEKKLLEWW